MVTKCSAKELLKHIIKIKYWEDLKKYLNKAEYLYFFTSTLVNFFISTEKSYNNNFYDKPCI